MITRQLSPTPPHKRPSRCSELEVHPDPYTPTDALPDKLSFHLSTLEGNRCEASAQPTNYTSAVSHGRCHRKVQTRFVPVALGKRRRGLAINILILCSTETVRPGDLKQGRKFTPSQTRRHDNRNGKGFEDGWYTYATK